MRDRCCTIAHELLQILHRRENPFSLHVLSGGLFIPSLSQINAFLIALKLVCLLRQVISWHFDHLWVRCERFVEIKWLFSSVRIAVDFVCSDLCRQFINLLLEIKVILFSRWNEVDLLRLWRDLHALWGDWQFLLLELLRRDWNHLWVLLECELWFILRLERALVCWWNCWLLTGSCHHRVGLLDYLRHALTALTHLQDLLLLLVDIRVEIVLHLGIQHRLLVCVVHECS